MALKLFGNRLLVSDFKTSFLFYRDVLGLKPTFGDEHDVYADFETGAAPLAIFGRDMMAGAIGRGDAPVVDKTHKDEFALVFQSENVDETVQELRKKGIVIETEPEDRPHWGIRTAHLRDPDGYLIEIFTSLPKKD